MPCTGQLGGLVLKASGRVQQTHFFAHSRGGSVSQLSQLTKLSPWLTLSTKDINTSFWHYNKWFWFLSNQIMGKYNFSNQKRIKSVHMWRKMNVDYLRSRVRERVNLFGMLTDLNWPQPSPILEGNLLMGIPSWNVLLIYSTCDYVSMLGLMFNYTSKRVPSTARC